jgi:hypothetical protein
MAGFFPRVLPSSASPLHRSPIFAIFAEEGLGEYSVIELSLSNSHYVADSPWVIRHCNPHGIIIRRAGGAPLYLTGDADPFGGRRSPWNAALRGSDHSSSFSKPFCARDAAPDPPAPQRSSLSA